MRAFVELISEISDKVIVSTLRKLWEVSAHKAWTDDKEEQTKYESIRVELMATIFPSEVKMTA